MKLEKWMSRLIVVALVTVGFLTKFYILALLGILFMIQDI